MLYDLTIRNIVLIDRLELEFDKGLTVLSGETGAGKSILLDSLGLVLGNRSDVGLIRQGADEAAVSANFIVPPTHPACHLLKAQDIPLQDKIYIKRKISPDGRSRAMVNDQPVSINFLKQLGNELVEIQGQFDQHRLLNPQRHLYLLDSFAKIDTSPMQQAYKAKYQALKALKAHQQACQAAKTEQEFILHAIEELTALAPQPNEIKELTDKRNLMMNAEKIRDASIKSEELLGGQNGAIQNLQLALRHLAAVLGDHPRAKTVNQSLETALIEMNEGQQNLQALLSDIGGNGDNLAEIDERLFSLKDIARKHRIDAEKLPELLIELQKKANMIDAGDDMLQELQQKCHTCDAAYLQSAQAVSATRATAKEILEQAIMAELPPLKMEEAKFNITISAKPEAEWDASGMDNVQFLLQSNPGQAAGHLHKIASGGELSRVVLALNMVFANIRQMAVLLFDEVDSGIGGQTAAAMGKRLYLLGSHRQVIVITHSPQISAIGNQHYHVSKKVADGSTTSHVKKLSAQERLEEVARMLSDGTITNAGRAAALKLLQTGHEHQQPFEQPENA